MYVRLIWKSNWYPLASRAIRLDPGFAVAFDARAELQWYLGFYGLTATKEAFTLAVWDCLRALEIDECLAETRALLAMLRKALDYNWPEVEREYGRAFEQVTDGDVNAAVDSYEQAAELGGRHPWLLGWLGLAYGVAGRSDQARTMRDELIALSASSYVPPFAIAVISLGLGKVDDAFRWMDRAIDMRDPLISPILSYPFLDSIRADPRFRALLARMNLADSAAPEGGDTHRFVQCQGLASDRSLVGSGELSPLIADLGK